LNRKAVVLSAYIAFLFIPCLRAVAQSSASGDEATKKEKTSGLTFLPVIYYTPETKWAFGGGGLYYFRVTRDQAVTRPSNISFIAVYTQRKQIDLEMNPDFYLRKGLHIQTKFQYSDFPDQFYGIGNRTTEDLEEPFTSKFWKLSVEALKKVHGPLNVGFQYFFDITKLPKVKKDGMLASGGIPGSAGGTVSGLGYFMTYDSRDSIFYPTRGSFHQFSAMAFGKTLGSDFKFNRLFLELRKYVPFSYAHCLAFQTRFLFQTGDPPFWRMGLLGGSEIMRGYYLGRYRDKNMIALQAEYRWVPVLWRIGLVAFAGFGDVAATLGRFDLGRFKTTYGLGLRFVIDPKQRLHLRVDFGFGKGTSGVYFTAGEAF
jgi:outer membrane protein assembly factor BamA